MFSIFAYPLLDLLRFFYRLMIHNYGVAIILLTLVVRILFRPALVKELQIDEGDAEASAADQRFERKA